MSLTLPLQTAFVVIAIFLVLYARSVAAWKTRSGGRPLPPGPKGLPILGNIFDSQSSEPWVAFRDACAKYGNMVHYRVLGQSILVLDDAETILECLDKRSANTCNRNETVILKLTGLDLNLALMPYGRWWRRQRRAFSQYFHPNAVANYRPVQQQMAYRLLEKSLEEPLRLKNHLRFSFASGIFKVVYGISIKGENDKYYETILGVLEAIAEAFFPGAFLVEYLPFLWRIPSWFPGTGWQQRFLKWQNDAKNLTDMPFAYAQENADRDPDVQSSVASRLLSRLSSTTNLSPADLSDEITVMKGACAVAAEGGIDTTWIMMQSILLALSLNPDVLKKAQAELDAVVGPHRLPQFGDKDSLVYINAIILESLRYHTVAPLVIPHRTINDDVLNGYFIPAGTIVIPNVWSCMHNPENFPDPERFRPERFIRDGRLVPGECPPSNFVFGFGRRICPGRHFGLDSLFIHLTSMLHVFDILPPPDAHGSLKPTPECGEDMSGIVRYLKDFRCTVKPRSAESEFLIRQYATPVETCGPAADG